MNRQQIKEKVLTILADIAPDADAKSIDPDISFHDQFEIDSIDFLRLMLALEKELKVTIFDFDYPRLSTLRGCVDYLDRRLNGELQLAG